MLDKLEKEYGMGTPEYEKAVQKLKSQGEFQNELWMQAYDM